MMDPDELRLFLKLKYEPLPDNVRPLMPAGADNIYKVRVTQLYNDELCRIHGRDVANSRIRELRHEAFYDAMVQYHLDLAIPP